MRTRFAFDVEAPIATFLLMHIVGRCEVPCRTAHASFIRLRDRLTRGVEAKLRGNPRAISSAALEDGVSDLGRRQAPDVCQPFLRDCIRLDCHFEQTSFRVEAQEDVVDLGCRSPFELEGIPDDAEQIGRRVEGCEARCQGNGENAGEERVKLIDAEIGDEGPSFFGLG